MAEKLTKAEIEAARTRLYGTMINHNGPDKKIGMGQLYKEVFGRPWHHRINDTRPLRHLITDMRKDGMPVLSDSNGYWLAASSKELNDFFDRRKKHHLKGLNQLARMKKVSLPEYLGQLQLELEGGDE